MTACLKLSLGAYIVVAAIQIWSGWQELEILQREARRELVTEAEYHASNDRQLIVRTLDGLAFLITAVLFLCWTYRSNRNAWYLAGDRLRFTPGWSVGWYFVPIAGYWKPYQAVVEMFKASHPGFDEDWRQAPRPRILPLWWALWVGWYLTASARIFLVPTGNELEALLRLSWVMFSTHVIAVLVGIAALRVVSAMHSLQNQKYRTLSPAAP